MNKILLFNLFVILFISACKPKESSDYLNFAGKNDQLEGGIKMIPITTPSGTFKVWTKRVGNNPKIKVLLLHGGPGATHELYSSFDGFLPQEGIEYYYYDQLGSYYSDQPKDSTLWTVERFVDEVDQVRKALGMNKDNFYLLGQSWGGMLAMEYALKHQDNLKGLIISNMMSDLDAYEKYAKETLGPQMPKEVFDEVMKIEDTNDFSNPKYAQLLMEHHYQYHVLRMPLDKWPEAVNRTFKHMNPDVYVYMQGHSEFGITAGATLKGWNRANDIKNIKVKTLVVGSAYDTMDPKHMEWMSKQIPGAQYLFCPNGSHMVQYDDQKIFFDGLIKFLKEGN